MANKVFQIARGELSIGRDLSDIGLKTIVRLYQESLSLPKRLPVQQLLLCPVGIVGAGKTTAVKPISRKIGLVRISSDKIRKLLHKKGFNYIRTKEIVSRVSEYYAAKGYGIVIDSDCVDPLFRQQLKKMADKHGMRILYIHINPPEAFIIKKLMNLNYKSSGIFKNVQESLGNYYRRKPLHIKYADKIKFYFSFDTSKKNLHQQVKEFIDEIRKDLAHKKVNL